MHDNKYVLPIAVIDLTCNGKLNAIMNSIIDENKKIIANGIDGYSESHSQYENHSDYAVLF